MRIYIVKEDNIGNAVSKILIYIPQTQTKILLLYNEDNLDNRGSISRFNKLIIIGLTNEYNKLKIYKKAFQQN